MARSDLQTEAASTRRPASATAASRVMIVWRTAHKACKKDIVDALFGFPFSTANISPGQFLGHERGQRMAAGALISSAKAAARATKRAKGDFLWYDPADYVTSANLKR